MYGSNTSLASTCQLCVSRVMKCIRAQFLNWCSEVSSSSWLTISMEQSSGKWLSSWPSSTGETTNTPKISTTSTRPCITSCCQRIWPRRSETTWWWLRIKWTSRLNLIGSLKWSVRSSSWKCHGTSSITFSKQILSSKKSSLTHHCKFIIKFKPYRLNLKKVDGEGSDIVSQFVRRLMLRLDKPEDHIVYQNDNSKFKLTLMESSLWHLLYCSRWSESVDGRYI